VCVCYNGDRLLKYEDVRKDTIDKTGMFYEREGFRVHGNGELVVLKHWNRVVYETGRSRTYFTRDFFFLPSVDSFYQYETGEDAAATGDRKRDHAKMTRMSDINSGIEREEKNGDFPDQFK